MPPHVSRRESRLRNPGAVGDGKPLVGRYQEVIDFCLSVGLPITLGELGCTEPTPEKIMAVAVAAADPGETIHNMPFDVNADTVYAAIMAADALGRMYLCD